MKFKIQLKNGLQRAGANSLTVLHSYDKWLRDNLDRTTWDFKEGSVYFKHKIDLTAFKLRFGL